MKLSQRRAVLLYRAILSLYWVTYGLMFLYVSKFLQGKGFSDSQIGICMGLTYAFTAVVTPMITGVFQKYRVRLNRGMLAVYGAILILAVLQLLPGTGKIVTGVLLVALLVLECSLQASTIALHTLQAEKGLQLSFPAARGLASFFYAIAALIAGQLLTGMPSNLIPLLYIVFVIPMIVCLYLFDTPAPVAGKKGESGIAALLSAHKGFIVFLIGVVFIAFAHSYLDTYLLQIFQMLGGDTGEQGIAIAVAGFMELPAMLIYSRVSKRTGAKPLLIFAGWVWVAKMSIIFLAQSCAIAIASFVLQFFSFAIYTPAVVDYTIEIFGTTDCLTAQPLVYSAWTVGSFLCALIGGVVNDTLGVRTSLLLLMLSCAAGALMFTVSVLGSKRAARK